VVNVDKNFSVSEKIRKASIDDVSRIAEILVFSKRKNYRHIFNDDIGSFVDLQVYPLAKEYVEKPELLNGVFVYDDKFIKGVITIDGSFIEELYVEPYFEGKGIGGQLIEFAKAKFNCNQLWVLDENGRAKSFYERHGFHETKETRLVPEASDSNILERKMIRGHYGL
jgi:putative acetyltransferase